MNKLRSFIALVFLGTTLPLYNVDSLSQLLNNLNDHLRQLSTTIKALPEQPSLFAYKTFDDWFKACSALPYYKDIRENFENKPQKLSWQEVEKTIERFAQAYQKTAINNASAWVDGQAPSPDFFDLSTALFEPYVQKLIVPSKTEIALHGDLHGDVHSLVTYLNNLKKKGYLDNYFKITKPNFYIVFLGDYTDRGNYGIEVIYTLMRLKIANPNHCILIRGNHEDRDLNVRMGFQEELETKFELTPQQQLDTIYRIYNFLPVALYLGSGAQGQRTFFQCCHGGMELGYFPNTLLAFNATTAFEWLTYLKRKSNLKHLKSNLEQTKGEEYANEIYNAIYDAVKNPFTRKIEYLKDFQPQGPYNLGFLWSDFIVNPNEIFLLDRNRGGQFGKRLVESLLSAQSTKKTKLVGVLRAHQHTGIERPMMQSILLGQTPGVSKLWWTASENAPALWRNMVVTFNVSPDTPYRLHNLDYNFDTYGLLTTGNAFPDDWHFEIMTKNIYGTKNVQYEPSKNYWFAQEKKEPEFNLTAFE